MITSRDNERLKLVRKLGDRRWRDKLGLFVAEGEDLVEAARAAGVAPVELLVAGETVEPRLLAERLDPRAPAARRRRLPAGRPARRGHGQGQTLDRPGRDTAARPRALAGLRSRQRGHPAARRRRARARVRRALARLGRPDRAEGAARLGRRDLPCPAHRLRRRARAARRPRRARRRAARRAGARRAADVRPRRRAGRVYRTRSRRAAISWPRSRRRRAPSRSTWRWPGRWRSTSSRGAWPRPARGNDRRRLRGGCSSSAPSSESRVAVSTTAAWSSRVIRCNSASASSINDVASSRSTAAENGSSLRPRSIRSSNRRVVSS